MGRMNFRQTTVTLPAGVSTLLAARVLERSFLGLLVIGTGRVNLNFNAAAVADSGWAMSAAAIAGDQGGGLTLEGDVAPGDAVYGISAAGSTVVVLEG